ncbi:DNA mismatch repair protein MutS [Paenibacillus sp. p3-SID867]|uniref:endonuclease MutS2 n=1 Tax=Paenibacillus sp. p3-SID867 TaxID=2916363 RepID=UPI0021A728CF|nr:DNA mismatch repair protein MutS [Paenibacillus sp. p3-SID867]MCT1402759.1 DNA mismatch repair protein MutS [Paenibacillus sp. p3-SID867]
MKPFALNKLEYEKIRTELERFAVSYLGVKHIRKMAPLTQMKAIRSKLNETEEAKTLLQTGASVPIPSLEGIEMILDLLGTGYVLSERDFGNMVQYLRSCRQLIQYMKAKDGIAPLISSYASSMHELRPLLSEIERSIHGGRVVDSASKDLAKIRKKIIVAEERIKRKLDSLMSRYKGILQEHVISKRGDRYVLPIKKEHRKSVNGSILDESASGQTVFIEPSDLQGLQMELNFLHADEVREETKVLSDLTALAEQYQFELRTNADIVGIYDYIIARGKYAVSIGGRNVSLNQEGFIHLKSAVHPLIGSTMVPLDFSIGERYKTLIITGPNTGGKTSALKTVGLITVMVQSGLLVPVAEGSHCAIFDEVSVDIGDGQSLEHALSTFSAHIRNIRDILQTAGRSTLVLLDEMASGTDPGEGVGLSIAILEELSQRQATVVVTTHFTEIKNFAERTSGFENARMEFDADTLEPLYRLRIGEAGHSYAFVIAAKLGIPESIIARSREITEAGMARDNTALIQKVSSETDDEAEETRPEEYDTLPTDKQDKLMNDEDHQDEDSPSSLYQLGDRVYVPYLKRSGTVYETIDGRGNIGVMIQKDKLKINHKRLKPYIAAKDLYPEDYDLDIVFESKENRKKRKLMNRKHVEGLQIETKPE